MPNRTPWRRSLSVTAVSALLLLSITNGTSSAGAAPAVGKVVTAAAAGTDPSAPLATVPPQKARISSKLVGPLAQRQSGARDVFVQLAGQGAAAMSAATIRRGGGKTAAKAASQQRKAAVRGTSAAVVAEAKSKDRAAKVLFQVSNAIPGIAISATDQALQALALRSDVVKISALVPKTVGNANTAQLTRVLNTWQGVGDTGAGVKIGIIDTGIDYTHADFGGPGTVAAWTFAKDHSAGPFTPTAKVVGGHDFAGDAYNAAVAGSLPQPDNNPLDCDGHGTHVAGTAAGYGVNANGSTFTGNYRTLTGSQLLNMKVGPGMAPKAALYALRVFGCTGSTALVIPALDWALDPNGDGDFSDHLDIVNLSLGSNYSPADDPENDVVDQLSANGVLAVIAAGNNGDLTDTGGSPGNAITSLAVASSVDSYQLRDGIRINAPATVAGIAAGQDSVAFPWATAPDVTGRVVKLSAANADGCDPLSAADKATVTGKVAWLIWDDNKATRRCGSVVRSGNVATAGAIGAIFTSGLAVFEAGITGSAVIPVIQLPKTATVRLSPAVAAGTLNVTFSGSLRVTIKDITPSISDTLSTFSSRGMHNYPGVVKPDVTAPGDTVASAGMGTGNGVLVESGTSMATPLIAGVAALVKKKHPTWTPEQIKAAVMNTAAHDLYTGPDKTGLKYGPARVGSGRVDALAAVSTKVLAYDLDYIGAVSASFGSVEAPINSGKVTRTQTVRVQNTDTKPVTVQLAYEGIVSQPGVEYTVSPATATIKASGSTNVKVTMTVTPTKLRRTIDPTMDALQVDPFFGTDRARQFVSDASGHLLIKQLNKTSLRVPVYGSAKPVSVTTAVDRKTPAGKPGIVISPGGIDQGTGSTAYQSKVSVMDLGFRSPREPVCVGSATVGCVTGPTNRSADLHYVGAGATRSATGSKANGWLWFGISTYGNWSSLGNSVEPIVRFDTSGDGVPDYAVDVTTEPATDNLMAELFDLHAVGGPALIDLNPVNFNDGDVDTNVFDTNTLLIPVWPAAIGITDTTKSFPITYSVATFSQLGSAATNFIVDQTPAISFDAVAPKVKVAGPLFADKGGVAIPYQLARKSPVDALVIHLDGKTSARATVLPLHG